MKLSNKISKKFIFYFLISLILLSNYSGDSVILKRRDKGDSGGSRWTFWVYGANGERQCANLCILCILILTSLLIICCGCCIWRYSSNKLKSNNEVNEVESTHIIDKDELREEAETYIIDNPPQEELPPPDRIDEIRSYGGARAWKWDARELDQMISIEYEGETIKFLNYTNVNIQTTYPFFVPVHDNEGVVIEGGQVKYSEAIFEQPQIIPHRQLHYYEMTILKNMDPFNTNIVIGLATKPYPNFRLPGLNLYSVGYHSIDGKIYNDSSNIGIDCSDDWTEAENIVGCGYYSDTGTIFFTKNGEFLDNSIANIKHVWFPTIGANGPCIVEINFGDNPDNEFKFKEAIGYGPGGPILKRRL